MFSSPKLLTYGFIINHSSGNAPSFLVRSAPFGRRQADRTLLGNPIYWSADFSLPIFLDCFTPEGFAMTEFGVRTLHLARSGWCQFFGAV